MTTVSASPSASAGLSRAFLTFWPGVAFTAVADGLASIALPFIVLSVRGSLAPESALGLVVLAGSVPRFAAPLLGALVDRWPLKAPLALTGVLRALVVLAIAALAASGHLSLAAVMTASLLNALLSIFAYTAASALVPSLVSSGALARANSLMTGATMGLPLIGYGLAGALVSSLGAAGTLALAAAGGFSLAAASLLTPIPVREKTETKGLWQDFLGGLKLFAADRQLLLIGVMSLLLNATLAAVNVLAPTMMVRLGRGAAGYGLFEGLISGAALAGIAAIAVLGARVDNRRGVTIGNVILLTGIALLTPNTFPAMLVAAAFTGLGLGILEVTAITLVQQLVPPELRGRLLGANMAFGALGLTVGSSLTASLAPSLPLAVFTLGLSAITLVPTVVWAVRYGKTTA
ncbi:MAG TPA: MFS transporter [Deinococcales bacterium]|nr:MFS transporter [Deinococcales bacterium]